MEVCGEPKLMINAIGGSGGPFKSKIKPNRTDMLPVLLAWTFREEGDYKQACNLRKLDC